MSVSKHNLSDEYQHVNQDVHLKLAVIQIFDISETSNDSNCLKLSFGDTPLEV